MPIGKVDEVGIVRSSTSTKLKPEEHVIISFVCIVGFLQNKIHWSAALVRDWRKSEKKKEEGRRGERKKWKKGFNRVSRFPL
jgi:hypothetical protein